MKKEKNSISLPKNIKQMGNIDESFKIYVEDYVFTYLQQYSKSSKGEEQIAFLIGDEYTIDNSKVLFINGAVKGEDTIVEDGMVKLTKKSFENAKEQINTYFENSKIVGWFYSQPGFSDYINEGYIEHHKEYFKEENQVFFLSDPLENIGGFYRFYQNDFKSVNGFIIYYEKNEAMSEYMLNNKPNNMREEEEKFKAKDERLINISRQKRANNQSINALKEYKKMSSIFSSLSAVLFLICFIMGAGLIQSDDKIAELEKRLAKLDESYRYILSQMKDDNVQSVFAQNSQGLTEETTEVTTKEEINQTTQAKTEETTQATTKEETKEETTQNNTISTQKNSEITTKQNINTQNLKKYEVKEGDSLELISKKIYGDRSKIEEIMALNNLEDPDKIYVGMTLLLPN